MKAILGYGIPLDTNENIDKLNEALATTAFHNLELIAFSLDEDLPSGPTCIMLKGYQVVGETEYNISQMESGLDLLDINAGVNIDAFKIQLIDLFKICSEKTQVVNSRWIFGITIEE